MPMPHSTVPEAIPLPYLAHYPPELLRKVRRLIESKRLGTSLLEKYPAAHDIRTDKALYTYVLEMKASCLKQSQPVSRILFDSKIRDLHEALGTHTVTRRVQGGKIKSKTEIRIASLFKKTPEAFLRMITVHELAHLKEKTHDKAFYKLCEYMEPDYHQLEFDLRLYLTALDHGEPLYS